MVFALIPCMAFGEPAMITLGRNTAGVINESRACGIDSGEDEAVRDYAAALIKTNSTGKIRDAALRELYGAGKRRIGCERALLALGQMQSLATNDTPYVLFDGSPESLGRMVAARNVHLADARRCHLGKAAYDAFVKHSVRLIDEASALSGIAPAEGESPGFEAGVRPCPSVLLSIGYLTDLASRATVVLVAPSQDDEPPSGNGTGDANGV